MRKVRTEYSEYIPSEKRYQHHVVEGDFHGWGNDYEEFETGPGNHTIAIVELNDGRIILGTAHKTVFLDKKVGVV